MRLALCIQNNDNTEIFIGNETRKIIEELFKSLLQKYQEGLEVKMRFG